MNSKVRVLHGPSELDARLLSNNSLDPWVDVNSGPRKVMFAGHMPQALVIEGSEERYWQTGAEARFGEGTFSVKAPCDMEVLKLIERIPRQIATSRGMKNPQTIVIYRDVHTRKIGCLYLQDYCLNHQYFGFEYKKTEYYHKMVRGIESNFEKGTPFLVSPSIKERGGYGYGSNLRFAFMSHPGTADDGIIMSRSALEKYAFYVYETRVCSWGQNRFALNLYGDENYYQAFPNIGQKIRPDGLLMATREHDERLSITNMGVYDTMFLDHVYDEKLYTRPGDGIIEDIQVFHDNRSLPNGTCEQIEWYKQQTDNFYNEIMNIYNREARGYKTRFEEDEFHQLMVTTHAMTDFDIGEVVQKLYHKAPIDDWRVKFTIKYRIVPDVGNKFTGGNGDKGVICLILPDEDMPVNDHGVRAEAIMSIDSPVNRQNFGAMYEPFFNQCTREILTDWTERTQLDRTHVTKESMLAEMEKNPRIYEEIWQEYIRVCEILSPAMFEEYSKPKYDDLMLRATRFSGIFDPQYECMQILSPTKNPTIWRQAVKDMWKEFRPRVTPVTYRDYQGNLVRTEEPIEIGHKYFLLLEKISDDWIAVSTARPQHLGVLGQTTSSDKYSAPAKMQAVKAISEAELRIILSYCGPQVAADLMDRNNSLATHREYVYSLLDSETPTNIERGVDRKRVPLGNNRALVLFKHILECNGYEFMYEEYVDHDKINPRTDQDQ